ncbi:MAG TPA: hypothetical protein VJN43_22280 [Bryobacteraceae bacterium]|nr:hypothetical protein [Bryobacteraceae bacterium]
MSGWRLWQLALVVTLMAACPARGQVPSDFKTSLPLPAGSTLVIGFPGGWEHWNDENRGVVKLARRLREEPGVFAETIENHRERLALELIRKALDRNGNGVLEPEERAGARIVLYGQSLGGGAAVKLARDLAALNIPVMLTVQVDSVGHADGVIPANVHAAANLFQHDGPPIMGRGSIRAADPSRTRILGNFQYHYWFRSVDMSSASWARKTLGGAHARMEQDPRVWARVEGFIRQAIHNKM